MAKTAHAQAMAVDRTPSMRGVAEGGWACLQVDRRMLSVGGRVYRGRQKNARVCVCVCICVGVFVVWKGMPVSANDYD